MTRHWHDDEFSYCPCDEPTPASRDREETRDARRIASEADDYVRVGDTIYRWSDLPSADEL